MIPELGQFALALALSLALVQGVMPILGAAKGNSLWMSMARPAARGQFVFVAIAFACLVSSFINNDFSVLNVATNSNSQLPLHYRITASWGSHEGSLLLWTLVLTLWTVAVTRFSRQLPEDMVARVLGVMGLVSVGFLAFMLFTSNPFDRLFPIPADGRDLNPSLQDAGMIIHPPMLYTGYVGFAVVFAFAIAALLSGKLDAAWARWSRPWATAAWIFLTLGIALGSFWAYYELGWGGWWFWDPVENASFMPWLVGTALIHSLAVTEKRGSFRGWTVLLAILAFSLSLLGAFLVRSGVVTSVHAFATDPKRGLFLLLFIAVVIGGSLTLYAWRVARLSGGGSSDLVSRESALLTNNVLLMAATGAVMLGTLYPIVLDVLGLGKISVGAPYFEAVFVPIMALALFMMGIGPLMRWKKASLPELAVRLRWAFAVSLASALLLPFALGRWSAMVSLGLLLAAWITTTCVLQLWEKAGRQSGGASAWSRLRDTSRSYYGMLLAHFGIAVFVVGVTIVSGYKTELDLRMEVGATVEAGGYTFRMDGATPVTGPNYSAERGTVQVTRAGKPVVTLYPENRIYTVKEQPMSEAAIHRSITRDLYVSMGEAVSPTAWVMRVQHKPFVNWIWGGCVLMALGGLLAASDRRYRVAVRRRLSEEVEAVNPAAPHLQVKPAT